MPVMMDVVPIGAEEVRRCLPKRTLRTSPAGLIRWALSRAFIDLMIDLRSWLSLLKSEAPWHVADVRSVNVDP